MNVQPIQPHPPSPSLRPTPETASLTDSLHRRLAWTGNTAKLERAVPPADKAKLNARLTECRRLLMPMSAISDREKIGSALARLFAGYPNTGSLSPREMIATYISKLSELPAWTTEKAIVDIERGRVGGLSPDFPPSATRIFQIAEIYVAEVRAEKEKIDAILNARVEEPAHQPSEEERARVELKMADFHKRMDGTGYNRAQDEKRKAEREAAEQAKAAREEHNRRMEYILQGYEPPTNKHGITITMSLAMATGMQLTKRRPAPPPKCEFSPEE